MRVCPCVLSFDDGTDERMQLRLWNADYVAEPDDEGSDQGYVASSLCLRGKISAENAVEDDIMGN